MSVFREFPKIPRLSRRAIITEKIDGTNASLLIEPADGPGGEWEKENGPPLFYTSSGGKLVAVRAGSRNRFITPQDDNFGFAAWVCQNGPALAELGVGVHFGEWWGAGIQRKYGLKERRFSLFNVLRWADERDLEKYPTDRPAICDVVPVLYDGVFDTAAVDGAIAQLRALGSAAAPGFMDPEGVVVYHTAAGMNFKKTLDKDEAPKGAGK